MSLGSALWVENKVLWRSSPSTVHDCWTLFSWLFPGTPGPIGRGWTTRTSRKESESKSNIGVGLCRGTRPSKCKCIVGVSKIYEAWASHTNTHRIIQTFTKMGMVIDSRQQLSKIATNCCYSNIIILLYVTFICENNFILSYYNLMLHFIVLAFVSSLPNIFW